MNRDQSWLPLGRSWMNGRASTTQTPAHPTTLDSSASACGSLSKLAEGKIYVTSSDNTVDPSAEYVPGLVPDGVKSVELTLSDGSTKTLSTIDDAYASSGTKAVHAVFTTRDGKTVTINL